MHKRIRFGFCSLIPILLLIAACQPAAETAKFPIPSVPSAASATMMVIDSPTSALPQASLPSASPAPTTIPAPEARWDFQTGGAIWGTPTIQDGILYFGSDDGNLYALDALNGRLKWKFSTKGLVRSRPAIADQRVFFTSDDGFLYAVDASNGQPAWSVDIGNAPSEPDKRVNPGTIPDPRFFDYLQSSPAIVDGRVFVGSYNGNVVALAADQGNVLWKFSTGGKVRASPAVKDGLVIIGSWDGNTYALDAQTGQVRWRVSLGGPIQTTALVANGLVYTASRKASVVALDAQTGKKKWELDYGRNNWVESSPVLAGNSIYIGSSGNQYVLGIDNQNGTLLTAYMGKVCFWSTPLIIGDSLYIGGEALTQNSVAGGLFNLKIPNSASAVDLVPSTFNWLYPTPRTLMPDGNWAGVASSPVAQNGVIYFGGLDGKFYALHLPSQDT